jgi:hypothetical protein
MIELIQTDEYGVHYSTETFLTVEDARDALNQMESALDDATVSQAYRLQDLINQLKESIAEHES